MKNLRDKNRLIWIDLEMSGLDVSKDHILEVAVIITDTDLEIVSIMDAIAIYQEDQVFENMCPWNKSTHSSTGLIQRCKCSLYDYNKAETTILDFLNTYCFPKICMLCGSSVYVDRKFISAYMPKVDDFIHYRIFDVSPFRMAKNLWGSKPYFKLKKVHSALADIMESIQEMKFYKNSFIIKQ